MPKPLNYVFSPVFTGSVPNFFVRYYTIITINSEIVKTGKQESRNLRAAAFLLIFLRILQDVSREKAMEQMFA
jgi:hypothetical protein